MTALLDPAGQSEPANREVSSAVATAEPTVPLSTRLGLIGQLQQDADDKAAGTPLAQDRNQVHGMVSSTKATTGAISTSLEGLSFAQAEALGLLRAGFANSLLVNLKQKDSAATQAARVIQGNIFLAKGGQQLSEVQGPAAVDVCSSDSAASATATVTSASGDPTAASSAGAAVSKRALNADAEAITQPSTYTLISSPTMASTPS